MRKLLFFSFALMSISNLFSQDLKVFVNEITDTRTTGSNSKCELTIKFTGASIQKAIATKFDTLTEATDNTGKNLIDEEFFDSFFNRFEDKKANSDECEIEIRLINPSRSATSISKLKGSILVYDPKSDPQSQKTLKGFIAYANKSIIGTPGADGFDVFLLDKESYSKLKEEEKKKINDKLQKFAGFEEGTDVEQISEFVKSFYDVFYEDSPNSVNFYVTDPNKSLISFEFIDEKGEKVSGSRSSMNNYQTYSFDKPITKDWAVFIQIRTAKSVKKLPFEVSNLLLP